MKSTTTIQSTTTTVTMTTTIYALTTSTTITNTTSPNTTIFSTSTTNVLATTITTDTSTTTTTTTTPTTASTTSTTTTTTTITTTPITSTTTTTTSTTTTTTSTTSTTTTTLGATCNYRWNTTAITIMNSSWLLGPNGLYMDSNDTLYIVDELSNDVVWKLPKNALTPTLVAGTLNVSISQRTLPQHVIVDSKGNVYISSDKGSCIKKYVSGSTSAVIFAGILGSPGSALNQLNQPRSLWLDSTETFIYIADCVNHRIMRHSINARTGDNGTLIAGTGIAGNTVTSLNYPWGMDLYLSANNDVYMSNYVGHSVMKWTIGASSGTFVAGTPGILGSGANFFNYPAGIRLDHCLNLYVADLYNYRIQRFFTNNQTGVTIAGTGAPGAASNQLNLPRGIVFDSSMNMYVADSGNLRVQKFLKL